MQKSIKTGVGADESEPKGRAQSVLKQTRPSTYQVGEFSKFLMEKLEDRSPERFHEICLSVAKTLAECEQVLNAYYKE